MYLNKLNLINFHWVMFLIDRRRQKRMAFEECLKYWG